jgi:hypothetical protein
MQQLKFSRRAVVLLAVFFLSISALPLCGQTQKATILGTITDSSHAVIRGAQVSVTETNTNVSRTEKTNDSGFYVFANMDPGTYRVEVEQPGFRKMVRSGIDVNPNTTARVDLELSPGAVSEVVDVTAEAPLLQTDRADTGGKIEEVQLQNLPLGFNRNYQSLIATIPGVGRPFRPHSEFYNSQDSLGARVNGMGRQMNNYQLEGIDNNIDTGNLTAIVLPAEAIATVDVSTSNYDPEFGRAGGAVTNVTMRSGTNQYHGSLFEFHQDRAIRATQAFAKVKPGMVYNQFGGTFGGRIIRDRLFFFGDYQGSRDHFGSSNLTTIPTMAFRQGDLSASPTNIYDPATGKPDGTERTPFQDKQIPLSRVDSQVQKILSFLPAPTSSGLQTNFQKNTVRVKNLDQFDIKIDYVLGPNDRLAGRYSYQVASVIDPGLYGPNGGIYGGPHNQGFSGSGPARSQSPSLSYSHIFSQTLVTEVRLGYVRNRNDALNTDYGLTTSKDIGIPGVNLDAWSSGLTQVIVNGFGTELVGYDGSLPWARAVTNYGVVNNWTKTKGNHVVKWGTDIRRERNDLQQTDPPRGQFKYTEGPTLLNGGSGGLSFGNSFAAFLLDQANSINRGLAVFFPARREILYNLYLQDKWQVSQKLTLDLGVRWEVWPAGTPHFPAGYSNYNPTNNTLELAGVGRVPNNLGIEGKWASFAPRFGAAYRLNEKTVVRGGYGISYLPRVTAQFNFPVKQANTFTAPNSFSAAGSLATGIPAPDVVQIPANGVLPAPLSQNYSITPQDLFHGYVQSWNIALQRALPGNFALEVAYIGNHGVNVRASREINYGLILNGGPASQPLNQKFGRRNSTTTAIGTHSYYDGLHVRFDRKFSKGLMITTSYTFSKAIDFCTDINCTLYNQFDVALDRARSNYDVTHVYVQSFIWDLPFGPNRKFLHAGIGRWILGDWQANGVVSVQTGRPLDITFSNSTLNTPFVNNRPNQSTGATPSVYGNVGNGILWFDTSQFSAPRPGTLGNVGRNILTGPGVFNLDFSLFRNFSITERLKGQLRLDSFNFTNTPHYDNPNTTFGDPNFGQVTTAGGDYGTGRGDPRQFQIGLRLFF